MMKVYDWAMSDVIRGLFFNIFVTGASVFVALFVGAIEWIQVIASKLKLNQTFFLFIENLSFSKLGIGVVTVMILSFVVAYFYI